VAKPAPRRPWRHIRRPRLCRNQRPGHQRWHHQDSAGNTAIVTLATPGAAGSLGANKALVIDTTAPTGLTITPSVGSGHAASFSGNAGHASGDNLTVTIEVCATNSFPCASLQGGTPITASVNPTTGAWSSASTSNLGNNATHYSQVTQTDLAGNNSTTTSIQFTS
jgi:hypothetical protein